MSTRLSSGRGKNCSTWAEYEEPGESQTAVICNGGYYGPEGKQYTPCNARDRCRRDTERKVAKNRARRGLPNLTTIRPKPTSRVIWSLPETPTIDRYARGHSTTTVRPPREVVTHRVEPPPEEVVPIHAEPSAPVVPPESYPVVMQTPYVMPGYPAPHPVTPVFLPATSGGVLERLLLNVIQGALAAGAQHVLEYLRHVDLFGRR